MKISEMLNAQDQKTLTARGLSAQKVEEQIRAFEQGFPYPELSRPCTLQEGLHAVPKAEADQATELFNQAMNTGRVLKFVPASGAASRMFKLLAAAEEAPQEHDLEAFLQGLPRFAFYDQLQAFLKESQGSSVEEFLEKKEVTSILKAILRSPGLNYAALPKGLIFFHLAGGKARTPFEEHLAEAIAYTKDQNKKARLHFTVSPEHLKAIESHIAELKEIYEKEGVCFEIAFSVQSPATDTLAVDEQNKPFRDASGQIVFRPGGHGALLANLNQLQGDIVMIKNIDNVVPPNRQSLVVDYKKILGGVLLGLQKQIFDFLGQLETGKTGAAEHSLMFEFLEKKLGFQAPRPIQEGGQETQRKFLFEKLNRPLRVCGMVKNEGEPGGGPFWVRHTDGSQSVQIIESAQVDLSKESQKKIWESSTHFNPVDLVCGLRDYQGKPFDLSQYVDPNTGFISKKSKDGKPLKALELPGLWNGAMAFWNTLFVEVPIETFNPVKTVMDLLRPEHQSAHAT